MSDSESELTNTQLYEKLKEFISEKTNQLKEELSNTITQLSLRLDEAESTIASLREVNKKLIKSEREYAREIKRNNIVIFGIYEEENEDLYQICKMFIKTYLKLDLEKNEINHIYRFGPNRTIVIKLISLHKKTEILRNGYMLKDTQYSISRDLIKEDREVQKLLRSHLKEARGQGKEAKIKNNKLIIENKVFTLEDIQKIEGDKNVQLDGKQKAATKSVSTKINTDKKLAEQTKAPISSKHKANQRPAASSIQSGPNTGTTSPFTKTRSKVNK